MKKLLLSTIAIALAFIVNAQQSSVIFFSEFGETFTLFINGVQQNDRPAANVRVDTIKEEFFQVRVDFEDGMNADFTANAGIERGMENTIIIKKNRKGSFVLRPYGVAPLGSTPEVVEEEAEVVPTVAVESVQAATPKTTTTTTTTTTTKTGGEDADVRMKTGTEEVGVTMKVGEEEFGVTLKVPGMETMESETTTTQVTTTTVVTESASDQRLTRPAEPAIPGYSGRTGCEWPTSDSDIAQLKRSIEGKDFEDSKLTLAKQATKAKCLTAAQVKEIMMLFDFEDSKLEYAKFAFDYTYDQDNYYLVNDAFDFELSIDELNEYLESR